MAGLGCCGRLLDTNDAVYGMRVEPKVYLANERTFLNWLQTSVTLGSIASVRVRWGRVCGRTSNARRAPWPSAATCRHLRRFRTLAAHAHAHGTHTHTHSPTRSPWHGRS